MIEEILQQTKSEDLLIKKPNKLFIKDREKRYYYRSSTSWTYDWQPQKWR